MTEYDRLNGVYVSILNEIDNVGLMLKSTVISSVYVAKVEQRPRNELTPTVPMINQLKFCDNDEVLSFFISSLKPQTAMSINVPLRNIGCIEFNCKDELTSKLIIDKVSMINELKKQFLTLAKEIEPNYEKRKLVIKKLFGPILIQTLSRKIYSFVNPKRCNFSWKRNQESISEINKDVELEKIKNNKHLSEVERGVLVNAMRGDSPIYKISKNRIHPEFKITTNNLKRSIHKAHTPVLIISTTKQKVKVSPLAETELISGEARINQNKKVKYKRLIESWYFYHK